MTFNHSPVATATTNTVIGHAATTSSNVYPVPFPKLKREVQMMCVRYLGSSNSNTLDLSKTDALSTRRNTAQVKP